MVLGPLRRRSQEWGWDAPSREPSDINLEEPTYVNDETAAAAVYLINDPKFTNKTNKWVQKRFKQTRNPDVVQYELASRFMNQLIDGISKLPSPYSDLAAVSLDKIDWDMLTAPYIENIRGPQYLTEEDELQSLERAIQQLPGDLQDLLPESDYELLEEVPEVPEIPRREAPTISYEEQYPEYRPTHTW